jgi:hypothetical protein
MIINGREATGVIATGVAARSLRETSRAAVCGERSEGRGVG